MVARRGADGVAPGVLERASRDVPAGDVAVDAGLEAGVAELDDDAVDGLGEARVVEEVEDEVVLLAQVVDLAERDDLVRGERVEQRGGGRVGGRRRREGRRRRGDRCDGADQQGEHAAAGRSCIGGAFLRGGDSGEVARQGPAADGERHEGEVDEQQPDRREHGDVVGQACRGTDELEGQVVGDAASGSALGRQGLREAPDDDDAHREARVAGDRADQRTGRAEDGAAERRAGEHEGDVGGGEAGVDVVAGGDREDDGHRGAREDRGDDGAAAA